MGCASQTVVGAVRSDMRQGRRRFWGPGGGLHPDRRIAKWSAFRVFGQYCTENSPTQMLSGKFESRTRFSILPLKNSLHVHRSAIHTVPWVRYIHPVYSTGKPVYCMLHDYCSELYRTVLAKPRPAASAQAKGWKTSGLWAAFMQGTRRSSPCLLRFPGSQSSPDGPIYADEVRTRHCRRVPSCSL